MLNVLWAILTWEPPKEIKYQVNPYTLELTPITPIRKVK